MTDLLARRDVLRQRQAAWRDLAEQATVSQMIATRSKVRFRSAVDVAKVQKTADTLSQELRKLDMGIQEANWLTKLID